jgi:uncharacterized UPF0146 family protein
VQEDTLDALVAHLDTFDAVVEVGVGHRSGLARALADRGVTVTATDIHERPVPDAVGFRCDDVTDPDRALYDGADAIYALNCPPELHRSLVAVGRAVDATVLFTTLGGDPPTVPVERRTLPSETLFVANPQ